jgi:hypothetical protein
MHKNRNSDHFDKINVLEGSLINIQKFVWDAHYEKSKLIQVHLVIQKFELIGGNNSQTVGEPKYVLLEPNITETLKNLSVIEMQMSGPNPNELELQVLKKSLKNPKSMRKLYNPKTDREPAKQSFQVI